MHVYFTTLYIVYVKLPNFVCQQINSKRIIISQVILITFIGELDAQFRHNTASPTWRYSISTHTTPSYDEKHWYIGETVYKNITGTVMHTPVLLSLFAITIPLMWYKQQRVYVKYMMPSRWMMPHDAVNKWKHFPRYWPFVRGIHRSPVNSPHKGQWHGALMFSLICAWTNGWANNKEAGDFRRRCAHYDVTVMNMHF